MDALAKRIIAGQYEVIGVLGEGGTGVVYDAIRTTDGSAVALKVMHASLAGDQQIRGRFQREAAILRRLEGEHVCPILDFGETSGDEGKSLLYIALPKINGESLAALLDRGLLDVDRTLDIMLQVLEALSTAHAHGIIHRDLKPANVLLDEGGTKAVVVDFGMSKIITGASTGTTNLTTHNMVFGTPEYMSPEQARGDELDARCDVYAAGIMLYEMLTGAPPYTGPSPLSVLTAHLTSELEPPSKRVNAGTRVTPALEAVVIHALARDRDERYGSAKAFAAAIKHARVAPNDVGSLRPSAFSASPTGTDAFAATFPATVVGSASVDVSAPTLINERPILSSIPPRQSVRSQAPSSTPTRPPTRRPAEAASNRMWILVWVVVAILSITAGVWFALRH